MNLKSTTLLARVLFALMCLCASVAARADTPIVLFKSFAGNVNFTGTQKTLRTDANNNNKTGYSSACATAEKATMQLSGLPTGATVLSAQLYWAGSGSSGDYTVTFDGKSVTAPATRQFTSGTVGYNFFSGAADVTAQVKDKKNGAYTVADLTFEKGSPYCAVEAVLGGFQLLVVYSVTGNTEPFRVLNVYEGFQYIQRSETQLTLANFLIPNPIGNLTGRVGHITWEGDQTLGSEDNAAEYLLYNGNEMTDALNPAGNQFNSKSSINNDDKSYGIDFDAYTVAAPAIGSGQTSAKTTYRSGQDLVLLNAEIIAAPNVPATDLGIVMTLKDDLRNLGKSRYEINVTNYGPLTEGGPITVKTTLPGALIFIDAAGTDWTCSYVKSTLALTCTYNVAATVKTPIAALPPITLTVSTSEAATGVVYLTASVTGKLFDYYDSNNASTVSARVGDALFKPVFNFTDMPCAHAKAYYSDSQPCKPVNFQPWPANTDAVMYITYTVDGVPTAMSNDDTKLSMKFGLSCHNPTTNAGVRATYALSTTNVLTLPVCEPNGGIPSTTGKTWSASNNVTFVGGTPSTGGKFVFHYADVGMIELFVSDATNRLGSTSSFVQKPDKLVLAAANNKAGTPASAGDKAFVPAGVPFPVTVSAVMVGEKNPVAPNFGREKAPIVNVVLQATPANTGNGPIAAMVVGLDPDDYYEKQAVEGSFAAYTAGVGTGNFSYADVGVIQLEGYVEGGYLSSGNIVVEALNVGRFYADHFNTAVAGPLKCIDAACLDKKVDTMAYSLQPFDVAVTAMNANNVQLKNYQLELARDVSLSAFTAPGGSTSQTSPVSSANVTSKLAPYAMGAEAFSAGLAKMSPAYVFPPAVMYSAASPASTSWPQPVTVYIRATETDSRGDGVTSKRAASIEGGVRVVAGRFFVANAHSSSNVALGVDIGAQFFGTVGGVAGWYDSTSDSLSTFALGDIKTTGCTALKGASKCTLTTPLGVSASTATTLVNGKGKVQLNAPGAGKTGSTNLSIGAPVWLPSMNGVLTFGIYRSPYIYLREMY